MNRTRGYCFTINNYNDDELLSTQKLLETATYGIYGIEIGNSGTQHIQGYGYWANKISFSTIKETLPRAHIECAKGDAGENQRYCSKDGNYTEYGILPQQGRRNDIVAFKDDILAGMNEEDLIEKHTGCFAKYDRFYQRCRNIVLKKIAKEMIQPEVIVITGEPGVGKTHTIYEENNIEDIYKVEVGDGSSGSVFWDNYNGENTILIDDFHSNLKLDYMLRLCDKYPMKLNIKGGHTWKCAKKIYITSNIKLDNWYPNCPDIHKRALKRRITKYINLEMESPNRRIQHNMLNQPERQILDQPMHLELLLAEMP